MDPNPKTSVLVRKETQKVRLSADRGGDWSHASAMEEPGGLQSMELKKRVRHNLATEQQPGTPEADRCRKRQGYFFRDFRGDVASRCLASRHLSSRTVKE